MSTEDITWATAQGDQDVAKHKAHLAAQVRNNLAHRTGELDALDRIAGLAVGLITERVDPQELAVGLAVAVEILADLGWTGAPATTWAEENDE